MKTGTDQKLRKQLGGRTSGPKHWFCLSVTKRPSSTGIDVLSFMVVLHPSLDTTGMKLVASWTQPISQGHTDWRTVRLEEGSV